MAIKAVVQTPSQIAAEVRRTGQIIPSRATIAASTLASLNDVSIVTASNTSVMMYDSGTATFRIKEHPYFDHTPGVLTANSAVLVDANSNIDYFSVENFRIQSSGGSTDYIDTIVQEITEAANNNQLATSLAIKTYVDEKAGSNVSITGGTITNLDQPLETDDGGTGLTSFVANGVFYAANTSAITFVVGTAGEILQWDNGGPAFGPVDGGDF